MIKNIQISNFVLNIWMIIKKSDVSESLFLLFFINFIYLFNIYLFAFLFIKR